jgi:hypothetical protein
MTKLNWKQRISFRWAKIRRKKDAWIVKNIWAPAIQEGFIEGINSVDQKAKDAAVRMIRDLDKQMIRDVDE